MMRQFAALRGRLMLMMLVAALPGFGVIVYSALALRQGAIADHGERLIHVAQTLAAEGNAQVVESRVLLAALARVPAARAGRGATCVSALADVKRLAPPYVANLFVVQPDGEMLCSAEDSATRINVVDMEWFRDALAAEDFRAGRYHLSRRLGVPVRVMTHTVRVAGRPAVVLGVALGTPWIDGHAEHMHDLPPGSGIGLVASGGRIVASQFADACLDAGVDLAGTSLGDVLAADRSGKSFAAVDREGRHWLFAQAMLGPVEAPDARVVAGTPVEAAEAEARRLLLGGLVGLAVASLLGLAVGWVGGDALVLRPLRPVLETVRRVAAGEFSARTGVAGGGDEIARLAEEVNVMAQALEDNKRLQTQLALAHKMEALGQLAGGIAHDFNNILASVLGFAKLALQRHVPDKDGVLADCLREVIAASERARDLVAKMLAFSRSQPAGRTLSIAPLPVARDAVTMLSATIPSSIRIDTAFADDIPDIAMDPVDFHQVFINLVVNARDAMDGKGSLRIGLARVRLESIVCSSCGRTIDGEYLELTVSDTGCGIAPEVLPRVFDPFFTTKEVGKGTGMGLAVVHGLVQKVGGHFRIESTPGKGTTFRIFLPPAAAAPATLNAGVPAATPVSIRAGGTVIVVDDDAAILRLLDAALSEAGWQVVAFDDPRLALEAFRTSPASYAAVVTDETMPEITGVELIAAVRKLCPTLPAILCTGCSDKVEAADARAAGADRFFLKPVDCDTLVAALAELVAVQ